MKKVNTSKLGKEAKDEDKDHQKLRNVLVINRVTYCIVGSSSKRR